MTPVEDPVTKPMIKSGTLWGLAAVALPFVGQAIQFLQSLPPGALPLPAMYVIGVAGWGFAVYRKLYGDNKPISGVIMQQS